jgi:16S rRNA (guanine527-N7)-methyltransferase
VITDEQQKRLQKLNEVFLEENSKLNLSAFRTSEACWIGNVMDSLSFLHLHQFQIPTVVAKAMPVKNSKFQILDIGTGGGFPLLPLAICLPETKLIGLDSTQKKIDAIQRIVHLLDVKNVQLLCRRTEELGRDPVHREQYQVVTARALAPLNVLLEYASPFVKPGGCIVAWKSMNIQKELDDSLLARSECSCQLVDTFAYDLDKDFGKRQLLIFEKRAPLSEKYPRAVGIPKKHPIS